MPPTYRERFLNTLLGKPVDRPPYMCNWGPWETIWPKWKAQGCPFTEWGQVCQHFGFEPRPQLVPVNCGPCPRMQRRVLEEDGDYYIWQDSWGIKRRDPKGSVSMSEFLEFPVKGREDWEQFKEQHLRIDHPDRMAGDWLAVAKRWMAEGKPIQLGDFPDVCQFGAVRWLLGDEECLLSFYTQPDLVHDIMDHMCEIYLWVFGKVLDAGVRVDVIHIWEDMSGKQGSLISPAHFDEFMTPNYRRIRSFADRHGIPLMSMDTDGQPDLIVPPMSRGGINYLFPLEVAAGCDVNVYQQKYPRMAFMGGIDKRALAIGPAAIDAELERIRPAIARGRYIPGLDHLIPDDVSWPNFCYYAERLRKVLGA